MSNAVKTEETEVEFNVPQGNGYIRRYLQEKGSTTVDGMEQVPAMALPFHKEWGVLFECLREIGKQHGWDLPRTMGYVCRKYAKGDVENINDVHRGISTYLEYYFSRGVKKAGVVTLDRGVANFLGLEYKKGGENCEWAGRTIKSDASLKFSVDYNWAMDALAVLKKENEVCIFNDGVTVHDQIGKCLVDIERNDGETDCQMYCRAILEFEKVSSTTQVATDNIASDATPAPAPIQESEESTNDELLYASSTNGEISDEDDDFEMEA